MLAHALLSHTLEPYVPQAQKAKLHTSNAEMALTLHALKPQLPNAKPETARSPGH